MLNRNKRKAIVEWVNAMGVDTPIQDIVQLSDGNQLFKFAQIVSHARDGCYETVSEKYIFVQKCLNDFFASDISAHLNFVLCEEGDAAELAKLTVLLLSAVVHVSLTSRRSMLDQLTQLDNHIQEDIHSCLNAVLKTDASLPDDVAAVLATQTKYGECYSTPVKHGCTSFQTPQKSSDDSGPGPKKRTRGRPRRFPSPTPVASASPSPLKQLLDSPQILHQVAMRERDREIKHLRHCLDLEENRAGDLGSENQALKKAIGEKDKEISELRDKINDLRKYRDVADELSACSLERKEEKKEEKSCTNCADLRKLIERLEVENANLNREAEDKTNKVSFLEGRVRLLSDEAGEAKESYNKAFAESQIRGRTVTSLQEEKKALEELATVNRVKYEEAVMELKDLQERISPPGYPPPETLAMVIEKRMEELNTIIAKQNEDLEKSKNDLEKKEQIISSQQEELSVKMKKIQELEEDVVATNRSHMSMKRNLGSLTDQLGKLEQENMNLQCKLTECEAELEKTKVLNTSLQQIQQNALNYEEEIKSLNELILKRETEYCSLSEQQDALQGSRNALAEEREKLKEETLCATKQLQAVMQENEKLLTDAQQTNHLLKEIAENMALHDGQSLADLPLVEGEGLFESASHLIHYISSKIHDFVALQKTKEQECSAAKAELGAASTEISHSVKMALDLMNQKVDEFHAVFDSRLHDMNSRALALRHNIGAISPIVRSHSGQVSRLEELLRVKDSEIKTVMSELKQDSEIIEQLKSCLELEKEKYGELKTLNESLKTQFQENRVELNDRESRINALEQEKSSLYSRIEEIQKEHANEKNALMSHNKTIMGRVENLLEKDDKHKENEKQLKQKVKSLEKSIANLQKEYDMLVSEKDEAGSFKEDNDSRKYVIESLKKENHLLKTLIKEKENEASKIDSLKEEYSNHCAAMAVENQKLKDSLDLHMQREAEKDRLSEQLRNDSIAVHKQKEELESINSRLGMEITSLKASLQSSCEESSALRSSLEEIRAAYEERHRHLEEKLAKEKGCLENELDCTKHKVSLLTDAARESELKFKELRDAYSSHMEECDGEKSALSARVSELKAENTDKSSQLKEVTWKFEVLETEKQQFMEDIKKLKEDVNGLREELHALEMERETLRGSLEDRERDLRCASERKELAEREYHLCVEQKDKQITKLEAEASELKTSLKSSDSRITELEESLVIKTKEITELQAAEVNKLDSCREMVMNDFKLTCDELRNKLALEVEKNARLLSDNDKLLEELSHARHAVKKHLDDLKRSKEENEKLQKKFKQEMEDFSQRVTAELQEKRLAGPTEQQLELVQKKYEKAKAMIKSIEEEKLEWKEKFENSAHRCENLHKKLAALQNSDSTQTVADLTRELEMTRRELEMTRESLRDMKEKLKQNEHTVAKMRKENAELAVQLKFADSQLRELNKQADRKQSLIDKRYSHIVSSRSIASSPYSQSRMRKSPLQKSVKKKGLIKKRTSPHVGHKIASVVSKKAKSPVLLQRNTSKSVTETYLLQENKSPSVHSVGSFNGSIASDGFNHSTVAAGNRFMCDDEEEFLNHSSLSSLRPSLPALPNSCDRRISELKRRNTLVPPHMKSSYPVEMQMQPADRCSDDSIREGFCEKQRSSSLSIASSSRDDCDGADSAPDLPKRKWDDTSGTSNGAVRKQLKQTSSSSSDIDLKSLVYTTSSGKIRNPFPKPSVPGYSLSISTPNSLKKFIARKKYEKMKKQKEYNDSREVLRNVP